MQKKLQQLKRIFTEDPLFYLCILFIALLPFYIGEIVANSHAYLLGKYINYLHIRISIHLLLGLAISYLYFLKPVNRKQLTFFLSILVLGSLASVLPILGIVRFTSQPLAPLFIASTFHLFEFILKLTAIIISTGIVLGTSQEKQKKFLVVLSSSIGIQLLIGVAQWLLKGPVFPNLLSWTGQPVRFTSESIIGIFGYARVYGTTPHPNILAGIMTYYVFLLFSIKENLLMRKVLITLALLIILGTLSKSALIAVVLITFIYMVKKSLEGKSIKVEALHVGVIVTLLVSLVGFYVISLPNISATFVESRSLIEKLYLELIKLNPLILLSGVGFTMAVPTLLTQSSTLTHSILWGNQVLAEPPHNILLLSVIELGIPLTVLLVLFVLNLVKTNLSKLSLWQLLCLAILVAVLGSLDHYLIY